MSFKDKVMFSMEAGKEKEHNNNIVKVASENILKTSAIYGANASGKTNLINAFTAAILMIRKSNTRQVGEKLGEMIPFAFDEQTKKYWRIFGVFYLIWRDLTEFWRKGQFL